MASARAVHVPADEGPTIHGPAGGPLTFFDAFAELPQGPVDPAAFRRLGEPVGMEVLGPPLR